MSISPSQIETWRLCKRKWAFSYISGLTRPPETKAQKIGIALHAKAERFIQTGQVDYSNATEEETEAARLLPAILPYLPREAQSEQKVKVTIDGVDFGGRYDWFVPYGEPIPGPDGPWAGAEIGDLKTTSSLRWAKTAEELSIHPQPLIYSAAVGVKNTDCRWVYVQTKGAALVREVRFKPDFSALPGIVADARLIQKAWTDRGDPNTYEPNLGACDAYGGCPYRAHCKVDSGQRLAMLMGLMVPKPNEAKAPLVTDLDKKEPPEMTTSFDALMAAIQAPAAAPAPAPTMAINPPPMVAVTRTEELPAVIDPAKAAPAPEVPAKRKRRTKAEMAADKLTEEAQKNGEYVPPKGEQVACDPHPKTDPAPARVESVVEKPIGTLYVSCMPDHDAENGAYIFNSANAAVSEQAGLADYRQAEYNKLQGHFVAAVVSRVKDIRPEHLFVDTRWAETNACLATLIAMSDRVVRAL